MHILKSSYQSLWCNSSTVKSIFIVVYKMFTLDKIYKGITRLYIFVVHFV